MKTANEVVKLIHALMNDENNYTRSIQAEALLKEYAREAMKEQIDNCEKAWLDANINNRSNHEKMMAIRNAPKPELK